MSRFNTEEINLKYLDLKNLLEELTNPHQEIYHQQKINQDLSLSIFHHSNKDNKQEEFKELKSLS